MDTGGYIGIHKAYLGFRDIIPRMENQIEKKLENEMEIGIYTPVDYTLTP